MPLVFQTSAAETPSKTKSSLRKRIAAVVGIRRENEEHPKGTPDTKPDDANNEALLFQSTPHVNELPVPSETQTKKVNAYKTSYTIIVHFLDNGGYGNPTQITIEPGTIVENNDLHAYIIQKKLLKTGEHLFIIWMHPQSEVWTEMRQHQPVPEETKSIEVLAFLNLGKPNQGKTREDVDQGCFIFLVSCSNSTQCLRRVPPPQTSCPTSQLIVCRLCDCIPRFSERQGQG
eukprot:GHVU01226271.1.p1 GENE.GHVU01226271.1~~GHVU01226271.1.p1  ORF type:complete len:231 (+),score=15.58 GHVU01226271.1:732-1424(+)